MKILQHYGIDVVFQIIEENFRDVLHNADIQYDELPILDVDVIRYVKDGMTKYACIGQEEEGYRCVYITEQIPDDLDFKLLMKDIDNQIRHGVPMEKESKLSKLICKVINDLADIMAAEEPLEDFFSSGFKEPAIKDIVAAFKVEYAARAYRIDDLKNMEHSDIDPEFFQEFLRLYEM